ncbi:hypothetical protein GH714_023453 [Hevea brasiliensis]|uniref:BURP domain-containing protein n=1 Tax=Hevea brasiliensis TaxID=3981 RepID=A0A6A6L7K1_HEVBR|nr:hypothetical protein GH714_023453 [Hevea brasiliensis]
MKLFSVFVIVILLLQVCLGHSFLSNAAKFSANIDVGIAIDKKHHYKKIRDARIHQERMCAIEHVELAARGASVFLQVPMATSKRVHVMQVSEPMEISPSALEFHPTIYK